MAPIAALIVEYIEDGSRLVKALAMACLAVVKSC
jgi:hypothetical protein